MNSDLTLAQAIDGYTLAAQVRNLSDRTISTYRRIFQRFARHIGPDQRLRNITPDDIRQFLRHYQTTPVPRGTPLQSGHITLSAKTLRNYHTALSSLWTWATDEGHADEHVVQAVDAPRAQKREIEPFGEAEVRAMMSVLSRTSAYSRPGKRTCSNARPTADRDRAIFLLLIDTGIRATELCSLTIGDINRHNSTICVLGKGNKERRITISATTLQALWRYLSHRPNATGSAALFLSRHGTPLTRSGLYQLVRSTGDRAGVDNAHPHRFRHTFAVTFLRNGGDIHTLQQILGHSTMKATQTYLHYAETDVEAAHRRASPVSNWRL